MFPVTTLHFSFSCFLACFHLPAPAHSSPRAPSPHGQGNISALVLTSQQHSLLLFLEHFGKEKQLSQIKPSLLNPFFLPIFLLFGFLIVSFTHYWPSVSYIDLWLPANGMLCLRERVYVTNSGWLHIFYL